MSSDPLDLDALGQAALVAKGEVSPTELVDAAIARIEGQDARINAVTMRLFDHARAMARQVDMGGPFRGVPFLVKDFLCHMRGTATTASLRWSRPVGQFSGRVKLGSGCRQAASLSVTLAPYASSGVRPANVE